MASGLALSPCFCGVRVVSAGKLILPRGWVLPRRVLAEDALLYVRRGRGEVVVGESVLPLRREHVYLLPREVPHRAQAGTAHILEHWQLSFSLVGPDGTTV
ncbi:MAG: AraC family ligand binding domain-containing protein, partial [Armatimonadota bacterium]|nr:AraC family ligand binding domain-containing protein [Armatimonadota bacterium]